MAGPYVGRAGAKLAWALEQFGVEVGGKVCADFGCAVGGFTDCLLKHGAAKVYAVDTAYGTLDWTLRSDERVVVVERTNAMHVALPERVDLVAIDAGWTRQSKIVPHAMSCTRPGGVVISLIKPHYECEPEEREGGTVLPERVEAVVERVIDGLRAAGFPVVQTVESPLLGGKGGNREFLIRVPVPSSGQ